MSTHGDVLTIATLAMMAYSAAGAFHKTGKVDHAIGHAASKTAHAVVHVVKPHKKPK